MSATFTNLAGKRGVVLGIANDKSIAAAVTRCLVSEGAQVLATCLNEKAATFAKPVTEPLGVELVTCNVEDPTALDTLLEQAQQLQVRGKDFDAWVWAKLEAMGLEEETRIPLFAQLSTMERSLPLQPTADPALL